MSDGNIDLIKAMLNRDVDQRLTITQVKEHGWCTEQEQGCCTARDEISKEGDIHTI